MKTNSLFLFFFLALFTSCTISETFVYDEDLHYKKVIEFELQDVGMGSPNQDAVEKKRKEMETMNEEERAEAELGIWLLENMASGAEDILLIDTIIGLISNVEDYSMDKVDSKYMRIQYTMNDDELKIKDKALYDQYVEKVSDNLRWYFKYNPNSIQKLDADKVLWKVLDVDIFNLGFIEAKAIGNEVGTASLLVTKTFPRKIKSVSIPNVMISGDRYSIRCKIELSQVTNFQFPNEIVIEFE